MNIQTLSVIGLGAKGLQTAIDFTLKGFNVTGIELSEHKYRELVEMDILPCGVTQREFEEACLTGLRLRMGFSAISDSDGVVIDLTQKYLDDRDHGAYVSRLIRRISPYLRKGQLIVLHSTLYPGFIDDVVIPLLTDLGWHIGRDLFLGYACISQVNQQPVRLLAGATDSCMSLGFALFNRIEPGVKPVTSIRTAELASVIKALYCSIDMAFTRELKMLATTLDIDMREALRVLGMHSEQPVTELNLSASGAGKFNNDEHSCSLNYLNWKAKQLGLRNQFLQLVNQVNVHMTDWLVDRLTHALGVRNKCVNKSKIAFLGISRFSNCERVVCDDVRRLMHHLQSLGSELSFIDGDTRDIEQDSVNRLGVRQLIMSPSTLRSQDVVITMNAEYEFDCEQVLFHSQLIFDTCEHFPKGTEKVISV